MNQQREVIYSLRSFALEGGEELKGEALKMIDKAIDASRRDDARRVRGGGAVGFRSAPAGPADALPAAGPGVRSARTCARPTRRGAARRGRSGEEGVLGEARESRRGSRRDGQPYGDRLLSLVMLNVLDEKWKDHLYDLDQLRNAIHYRSWGQKDPLIEYKQEAYTMFVDLMNDIYNTFSERFLKVQLVLEPPPAARSRRDRQKPTKRYNALGILEDIPADEPTARRDDGLDVGPAETPSPKPVDGAEGSDDRRSRALTLARRKWDAAARNRLVHRWTK